MANKIFVGDFGIVMRATVKEDGVIVDISGATTKQLRFRAPDGTTTNKTAAFTTDGTDGQLQYLLQTGDIDQIGPWEMKPYLVLDGFNGHGSAVKFTVLRV